VPSALAATPAVTVTTSFSDFGKGADVTSLNTSYDVGYAITNTTSSTISSLTFTDTLPAGVTLDNPIGLTNTAGTNGSCATATATNPTTGATSAPGDSTVTITVTGVQNVAGTVCTISLGIVAGRPSAGDAPLSDTFGALTAPVTKQTPGTLVVLTNPVVTLSAPTNGLVLKFGQTYHSNFSCATTDALDSISSLFGDDSDGNQVSSGEPIDTVDAGPNTFEVDCYSGPGGGDVTQTVNYTVKPFRFTAVKSNPANGQVSFKSLLPAGKGVVELLDGKKIIGHKAFKVHSHKTAKLSVTPSAAGAALLTAAGGKAVKVKLEVSYTPAAIGAGADAITPQGPTVVTRSLKLTATS